MTNSERQAYAEAAREEVASIDKSIAQSKRMREAAERLVSELLNLECSLSSRKARAQKVADEPIAANIKEAAKFRRHEEIMYGRTKSAAQHLVRVSSPIFETLVNDASGR